jgi:hypothetical protein
VSPPLSGGTGNNALDFPSVLANVMYTPRQVDLNGWPYQDPATGASVYFRSGNDIPNPHWVLRNYSTTDVVNRVFASTALTANLLKGLDFLYRVGLVFMEPEILKIRYGIILLYFHTLKNYPLNWK